MMTKKRKAPYFLSVALIIVIVLNCIIVIQWRKLDKNKRGQIDGLCATVVDSAMRTSEYIDAAISEGDRSLALEAGNMLRYLDMLIHFSNKLSISIHNTYGNGSISSLSDLFFYGFEPMKLPPLGSKESNEPYTQEEINLLQTISHALEEFSLEFYSESVTAETYMNEPRKYSDIYILEYALEELQKDTEHIFTKWYGLQKP